MLSSKILMIVHEVKAPADQRFSHRDRLKSLLTDSSITINEKHEPRWIERFCARFLMFTNRDDALPLSETDRRVYVVRCADRPRGARYYEDLYARVESDELLAAVWCVLRTRDITKFNPGRRAPLNSIKMQMIAAGRTEEQQTAAEFAQACPHDVVAAVDLMRLLLPVAEDEREAERKVRVNAIAAVFRELGGQTYPRKVLLEGKSTRVWMLRNPAHWSLATPARLRREVMRSRNQFADAGWGLDGILRKWKARA
jgi:hypothetical protein